MDILASFKFCPGVCRLGMFRMQYNCNSSRQVESCRNEVSAELDIALGRPRPVDAEVDRRSNVYSNFYGLSNLDVHWPSQYSI
jgi:hypothetical protein